MPCPPLANPGRHFHQQGGPGNAGSPGPPAAGTRPRRHYGHLPRRLRPHPAPPRRARGPQLQLHHLRPGRPAGRRQIRHAAGRCGREALPAPRHPLPHLRRQKPPARRPPNGADRLPRRGRIRCPLDRHLRSRLSLLRGSPRPPERPGLRRPAAADSLPAAKRPRGAGPVSPALSLPADRRVPGYQHRPVPPGPAPHRRPPQPLRRRRPRPEHLLLAQRRHPQHIKLPDRLPRHCRHQPGRKLPFHQKYSQRRRRRHRRQHRAH